MNLDHFGMDTITLAGPLEPKLRAVRAAGFTQIMLNASDIVGHPSGEPAAVEAVRQSGLRVTGFQVLRDFEGQRLLRARLGVVVDLDVEGVVDLRHGVDGELHVDDRADDPGYAAGGHAGRWCRFSSGGHSGQSLPALASARALAPPTISLISWVISAWRAALASRERLLMSSPALSVADFIARRRAACSEAAD